MTRTESVVSSRPKAGPAASRNHTISSGLRRMSRRGALIVPILLALMAPAAPALAAAPTSGYTQEPNAPTTTPKSGTAPSKSSSKPSTGSAAPSTSSSAPTTTTATPSNSTLPFTGLDLRWIVGGGLLLLAAGLSIRLTQRRQRGGIGR
jgi:hypothetical protein